MKLDDKITVYSNKAINNKGEKRTNRFPARVNRWRLTQIVRQASLLLYVLFALAPKKAFERLLTGMIIRLPGRSFNNRLSLAIPERAILKKGQVPEPAISFAPQFSGSIAKLLC